VKIVFGVIMLIYLLVLLLAMMDIWMPCIGGVCGL